MADNLSFNIVVNGTDDAERNVHRVGNSFKDLADQAEKAQKSGDLGPTLKDVETNAEAARVRVEELGKEFEQTGSLASFKGLQDAQKDLAKLQGLAKDMRVELEKIAGPSGQQGGFIRRLFGDVKGQAESLAHDFGQSFEQTFGQGIGGFLSSPTGLAVVIPAAIIGGEMIGGALLTGIGLAGIGAGIAGQLHSPDVQAALGRLGNDIKTDFTSATSSFHDPLIASINDADRRWKQFAPSLKQTFDALAPEVQDLERGTVQFGLNLLTGIEHAAVASKPLLHDFAGWLPQFGSQVGRVFDSMAAHEGAAAQGLHAIEDGLSGIVSMLPPLISVDSALAKIISYGSTYGEIAKLGGHATDTARISTLQFSDALFGAASNLLDFRSAAQKASDATVQLENDLEAAFRAASDYSQANGDLVHDMANLKKALDLHHKTLIETTDAGHQNADALRRIADEADRARQAAIQHAGGVKASQAAVDAATHAYNEQIRKLEDMAIALGFTKDQVHGLLDSYLLLEHQPNIFKTVTVQYNQQGQVTRPGTGNSQRAGLASGGSTPARVPVLVGEHGPEIFVPDSAGTVMPNGVTGYGAGSQDEFVIRVQVAYPDGRVAREQLIKHARQSGFRRLSQIFPDVDFS